MTVVSGGDRTDEAERVLAEARVEDSRRLEAWSNDTDPATATTPPKPMAAVVEKIAALLTENESLRARVEAAEAEPREPDDGWTPSTEQVRAHYVFDQTDTWDPNRGKAFDRWLAARDARIRRAALEEAADAVDEATGGSVYAYATAAWLRARAAEEGEKQ